MIPPQLLFQLQIPHTVGSAPTEQLWRSPSQELVEDVEVPLALHVPDNAGFLQQVCGEGSVSLGCAEWKPPGMGGGYSQLLMTPPRGSPLKSNSMSMYLPWGRGLGQERGPGGMAAPLPTSPSLSPPCSQPHQSPHGPTWSHPSPQVTHESGGVVITDSLGVSKGCRRGWGLWCSPGGQC